MELKRRDFLKLTALTGISLQSGIEIIGSCAPEKFQHPTDRVYPGRLIDITPSTIEKTGKWAG